MAKSKRLNKNIGKTLKKLRNKLKMPLSVVVECLKDEGIKYYTGNLSRVERQENSCSVEVFAALCKIYEVDPNDVIYR